MDMQMTITRAEHEEFKKRLEEKNDRQDKRLSLLEQQVEELKKTAVSIERLLWKVCYVSRNRKVSDCKN